MMRFIMVLVMTLNACGADPTDKKFRDEKDQRIEAQRNLSDSEDIIEILKHLISSTAESATMQWIYLPNQLTLAASTKAKAAAICEGTGFALPTLAELTGEGATVPGIQNIGGIPEMGIEYKVYTQDLEGQEAEQRRFLVCVRKTPAI